MINLLVLDCSHHTPTLIQNRIGLHPDIIIIKQPFNGFNEQEALNLTLQIKPDVIVMNLGILSIDWASALKKIMQISPLPIIVVGDSSTFTAKTAIEALALGAVEAIPLDLPTSNERLLEKIIYWGDQSLKHILQPNAEKDDFIPSIFSHITSEVGLIVIGTSTGGPITLLTILKAIKDLNCPIVIGQHLPKNFTKLLASYLHIETGLNIVEGRHGLTLYPGLIVIARGGVDSFIQEDSMGNIILQEITRLDTLCHPSIDLLFESAAQSSRNSLGIILTGMGTDGKLGARAISNTGNILIVQSPETCMVDTMPKTVIEDGHATYVLNTTEIAGILANCNSLK